MDGMAGRNVLWSVTVLGMLAAASGQTADGRRAYAAMCESLRTFNEVQAEAGLPEFNVPTPAEWAALQDFPGAPTALAETVEPPPPPLHHLAIQPSSNGTVNLQLNWPSNLTDRLELFATTNLTVRGWQIVQSNILTALSTDALWNDSATGHAARFYAAGSAELDSDSDRIPNLRERLLHGTDPLKSDTDGDLVSDLDEIESGTDPTSPSNYWIEVSGTIDRSLPPSPLPATIQPYDEPLRVDISHILIDYSAYPRIQARLERVATSNVDSNNAFQMEHAVVNRLERIMLYLFFSSHGIPHSSAEWPWFGRFGGGIVEIDMSLASFVDMDGLSSVWRIHHGLSREGDRAGHLDPDGDGLVNLHEYWSNGDPNAADAPANTALADATQAIDGRIAKHSPTNALRIFSVQDHANARYVRNTSCWAADIDLTCASSWNSHVAHLRPATLISPRHVLFAAHYSANIGSVIRFIDRNNRVVERTLIAKKLHQEFQLGKADGDLVAGLLNADVPTNRITFAKVLPDGYRDYIGSGKLLPVLQLDQEEKALVNSVKGAIDSGGIIRLTSSRTEARHSYWENARNGDSGNPVFLILGGEPILLQVNATRPFIPGDTIISSSVVAFKADINRMVAELEAANGITNGYRLTEIDLSAFHSFSTTNRQGEVP